MNCQEVMEYMQRELDGDLDDRETEILMTHTRHCPECTAVFERLKLLSAGLDNLPKVTPGYSLVDAIMPKLLELQTSAELMAADPVRGEEPEGSIPRRRQTQERRKNRFSYRIMGGVVAAGIVVGLVFIANPFEGFIRTNSSDDSAMTADTFSADTASKSGTFSSQSTANSNAPKSNDEVSVSGNNGVSESASVQDQAASDSKDTASSDKIQRSENPAAKDIAEQDSPAKGEKSASPAAEPEASQPDRLGNSSGNGAAKSDEPTSAAPLPGIAPPDANNADSAAGMSAIIHDPVVPSPDKRYAAAVVDGAMQIYTTSDNVKIFQGEKRTSELTNLVWAADSKTFTYETAAADGKQEVYVVDLTALSESLKADE
ncbi:zf-HC2 domain-containing protein [Paenibacillus nasutitermitis]|uniref:Putative zinc-finger domain-containing protein n=1 Tax=Paenibacillus nasutitermitis TaxID=1652958 RepID=A0A916Z1N4_9BACL|nr:zf-HC2 domain-containing protein [Paenibacillus nasutitermitis]GGD71723.1 hypothetical protein GCM10010911_32090 [Paenibacillus nasutitermitis]